MNNNYYVDEKTLPKYLRDSIKEFLEADEEKEHGIMKSIIWGELYGAINMAQHDFLISKKQADYLREKYLGFIYDENELK